MQADSISLECIDGKDDHTIIPVVQGITVCLGRTSDCTFINELALANGVIKLSNTGNLIYVDASKIAMPVKINGKLISSGVLQKNDLLRIGNSVWKPLYAAKAEESIIGNEASHFDVVREKFTSFIGLEELKDFRLQEIFSSVFKKHSVIDMEDQLLTGTTNNTPSITEIEVSWARPWLFARLILLSIILTVLLISGFRLFQNDNLLPGLIFIGSFAMPLATVIFFMEMNAPRNISIFMIMLLFFAGGVISLFVALIFFNRFQFISTILGASAAGIFEESAKLLIVLLLVGKLLRYKWVLNGLLFGAAIGAGFGAFESAGYAFSSFMTTHNFNEGMDSIVLRGLLAPFMHVVWTANAVAALWLVKSDHRFQWSMLSNKKFLRIFSTSVILHMLWNAPFALLPIPFFLDLKFVLLGIMGWIICFRLVQEGLKQLNEARTDEIKRLHAT